MTSKVTTQEVNAFYAEQFPDSLETVLDVAEDYALLRRTISEANIRPGGLISGPTQMAIADSAAYVAIFTRTGIVPMAVTSTLTINFLRPCVGSALVAEAHLLKLGKALAVVEVAMRAEEAEKISSHAIVNYALPRES